MEKKIEGLEQKDIADLQKSLESRAIFLPPRILVSLRNRITNLYNKVHCGVGKMSLTGIKLAAASTTRELGTKNVTSTTSMMENLLDGHFNETIQLPGAHSTFTIRNATECIIKIGPCSGAISLEDLSDCTLHLAAHQIRLFRCQNLVLNVFTRTNIISEESSGITIKESSPWYDHWSNDLIATGLSTGSNNYSHVINFTDL